MKLLERIMRMVELQLSKARSIIASYENKNTEPEPEPEPDEPVVDKE